jgi:hypothetical protein
VYAGLFFGLLINEFVHIIPFFQTLAAKRNDFIMDSVYYAQARSYISIGMLKETFLAFLIETPVALVRGFSLPLIWKVSGIIEILPALENVFLYMLVLMVIVFYKRPNQQQKNIIFFSFFFSFGLIWLVGITTPIIGAIVRYKVPIFPFLYTIFAMLIDWHKVLKLLRIQNGNSIV